MTTLLFGLDLVVDQSDADQPPDGWHCPLLQTSDRTTTAGGDEGASNSHVVSTISADQGRTWSKLVELEPVNGPPSVYSLPAVTPSGRVYVFYDYNGDNFRCPGRSDCVGWFVYKYSDDNGRTWSKQRYRLPMRMTAVDRTNTFQGKVQIFWGIGKPITFDGKMMFAFSKCGKYLFWFHHHGAHKTPYRGRNPAWLSGGIEKDGFIHWSQPEVVLYDPDPKNCVFDPQTGIPGPGGGMSYPDLIEQNGGYWITETQKTVARVHPIDSTLLEGLWSQGKVKKVTTRGLALNLGPEELHGSEVAMPRLPPLADGGGFSVDFWFQMDELSAGQILLDSRDGSGKGFVATTTKHGTIRIEMSDGEHVGSWQCDHDIIKPHTRHHVAIIVDGGPNVVSFVVDGNLSDGGTPGKYGWGRFSAELNDVSGSSTLRIAPRLEVQLDRLRIYRRYLRTSEAVANYQAGICNEAQGHKPWRGTSG